MQAVLDLRADTCTGCGARLSKSLRVQGKPDAKWVHPHHVCTSCVSLRQEMDVLEKKDDTDRKAKRTVAPEARKFTTLPAEALELIEQKGGD